MAREKGKNAPGAGKGRAGKRAGKKTPGSPEAAPSGRRSGPARQSSPKSDRALPGAGTPPANKLYSSGEVVRASGISRQVLHNYTVLGLLQPVEVTDTNRRYYDERVFGRIRLIRRMLASGYRLTDLRETFRW